LIAILISTDKFQNHLDERTESGCWQPQSNGPQAERINCRCGAVIMPETLLCKREHCRMMGGVKA
jgi:hypothetical protein